MSLDKPFLRAERLKHRQSLSGVQARAAAQAIAEQALTFIPQTCRAVGGYAAIRGEVSVTPLLEKLAAQGVITALPFVAKPQRILSFRAWKPGEPLGKGAYEIEEPLPTAKTVKTDVLLVPMLAFDRQGHRLGYGGGYYDRTLEHLRKQRQLKLAIGIAYGSQEVALLPSGSHDQRLDVIVTEKEVVRITI